MRARTGGNPACSPARLAKSGFTASPDVLETIKAGLHGLAMQSGLREIRR
jgi:hypothetical protein